MWNLINKQNEENMDRLIDGEQDVSQLGRREVREWRD